ncbi:MULTISPECIES: polysaccharide biosynthesis protein [Staphylococcus]|uniref:polysaccharide biosynthesis protein n=1 Tax=Staphylococcus TaxID=1279 RepID=UPI0002E3C4B7|nr:MULTISPECIES: polysaccharide biosynthesis protein [Staphylococcus]MBM6506380.1 polysaccharide biosynthesis protein [Staphylococcus pasteuri]QQT19558.1 polysaccharide biosynthesis protein [Staphylococcus pasteuri]VXC38786.1 Stage V sporulation protein B [Staphylococcus sp. 8AQ]
MKHKPAFNGVVILTIALIVIKILSAIYRIPYQNILGDEGLYAYQQIYPIVALGMILSMNAIPSAVTQNLRKDQHEQYFSKVLLVIQSVGFVICIVIFSSANMISKLMGDVHLTPMIRMASFSFIFVGVLGVLRGYFQSKQEMNIPAISQVIEQLIRVCLIMIAILLFVKQHWSIYQAGTLAIIASSIGFLGSTLYLLAKRPFKLNLNNDKEKIRWKNLLIAILIFALSQLIVILWQVADSFTVIHTLKTTGLTFIEAIKQKGVYDRGASFIQMGLIVTTTFSFVLIPLLTDAIQKKQSIQMNRYANASLKITVLISSAAGVGIINVLPLMNQVFFKTDSQTSTLCVYMLTVIGVSLIMMDIALLQVINNTKSILIGFISGLLMKIILNVIFIHQLQILGASISTVLSLIIFCAILHWAVLKSYHFSQMGKFIIKLVVGLFIMSVVVQIIMFVLPSNGRVIGLISLMISALIGVGVFMIYVGIFNVLSYRELKFLPLGDKLYHFKRGRR